MTQQELRLFLDEWFCWLWVDRVAVDRVDDRPLGSQPKGPRFCKGMYAAGQALASNTPTRQADTRRGGGSVASVARCAAGGAVDEGGRVGKPP